jgi:pyruvyltransferase
MSEISLFAFGFYPNSRNASASRVRRLNWRLKRFKQKIFHRHNFGDFLSYHLVAALSQSRVRIAQQEERGKLLAIGSILWSLQDQDVIWGSGAHRENQVPSRSIASCHAVRGPLTLRELKRAGSVSTDREPLFFDPAILLPLLHPNLKSPLKIKGQTSIVPHYTDMQKVKDWLKETGQAISIIDPMDHPLKVAQKIAQSERVLSSSLHGIILADAFNVPVVPLRLAGNREPEFKYVDYYEGSGRSAPRFSMDLREALDRDPPAFQYAERDLVRFLRSFPYPMKAIPGI